jgi:quinol monooxygenase YgiN
MIVLIAQHFAQEGKDDKVAELLRQMSAYCNSNAEPGCLLYIVNRSSENPRHFLIYEQYADEAALAAHAETPMFRETLLGKEVPLLESRERSFWTVVESDEDDEATG